MRWHWGEAQEAFAKWRLHEDPLVGAVGAGRFSGGEDSLGQLWRVQASACGRLCFQLGSVAR